MKEKITLNIVLKPFLKVYRSIVQCCSFLLHSKVNLLCVCVCVCVCVYTHMCTVYLVTQSCPTLQPITVAHQASLSIGFSRKEYWSGLPFHPPGYLPIPGIQQGFPTFQADSLLSQPPEKPVYTNTLLLWISSHLDHHRALSRVP